MILIRKIAVYVTIEAVSFFCDSKIYKLIYDLELSCHVVMVNLNILLHFFENYEQYAAIAYRLNFLKIFVNDVELYDYSKYIVNKSKC